MRTILLKGIVYTLLISQVLLYMIVPGSPEDPSLAKSRMDMDDFLIEQVLRIPDQTPADESDDTQRVMQLVQVERFHRHNEAPTPISKHITSSRYSAAHAFHIASLTYEILVPPPLL